MKRIYSHPCPFLISTSTLVLLIILCLDITSHSVSASGFGETCSFTADCKYESGLCVQGVCSCFNEQRYSDRMKRCEVISGGRCHTSRRNKVQFHCVSGAECVPSSNLPTDHGFCRCLKGTPQDDGLCGGTRKDAGFRNLPGKPIAVRRASGWNVKSNPVLTILFPLFLVSFVRLRYWIHKSWLTLRGSHYH